MKFFILFVTALALIAPALGKIFTRCTLAQEMYALGVPKSELPQWTCIAENESAFRTYAVGPTKSNGSNDYGIFQINNHYWCQSANGRFSYNECKVSCDDLMTDAIDDSVTCARKIKAAQGWSSWSTWSNCNGDLPSIDDCF